MTKWNGLPTASSAVALLVLARFLESPASAATAVASPGCSALAAKYAKVAGRNPWHANSHGAGNLPGRISRVASRVPAACLYAVIVKFAGKRWAGRADGRWPSRAVGGAHEIDFTGFSVNHVFDAGNRIRVRVATRDFLFFYVTSSQPTIKIYRTAANPSHIVLPIVP